MELAHFGLIRRIVSQVSDCKVIKCSSSSSTSLTLSADIGGLLICFNKTRRKSKQQNTELTIGSGKALLRTWENGKVRKPGSKQEMTNWVKKVADCDDVALVLFYGWHLKEFPQSPFSNPYLFQVLKESVCVYLHKLFINYLFKCCHPPKKKHSIQIYLASSEVRTKRRDFTTLNMRNFL